MSPCLRGSRWRWRRTAAALALLACAPARGGAAPPPRDTFSIDYIVTVAPGQTKQLRVRWELAGAEEVTALHMKAPATRFSGFAGSGTVNVDGDRVTWRPNGPYGHLDYRVAVDHVRGQHGRFDSYGSPDWIAARARDFFPRVKLDYNPRNGAGAHSHARLLFELPSGWSSAAAHHPVGRDTYEIGSTGRVLERPHGWIALGRLDLVHDEIDGLMVRMARAPGAKLPAGDVLAMLGDAVPRMRRLFGTLPDEILIFTAPDPMWHGGLSAFRSFFLHGDRPIRTPDKTSPVLHELFHVLQPFTFAADGDWIAEGLAEYYSLELQQRAGLVTTAGFNKGLHYFARFGMWNVNLTTQRNNAATNNSAPLIMYVLDQRIQHATAGQRRLDDVVSNLATHRGAIGTADLRAAIAAVSGKPFGRFFDRHVLQGEMPKWERAE